MQEWAGIVSINVAFKFFLAQTQCVYEGQENFKVNGAISILHSIIFYISDFE